MSSRISKSLPRFAGRSHVRIEGTMGSRRQIPYGTPYLPDSLNHSRAIGLPRHTYRLWSSDRAARQPPATFIPPLGTSFLPGPRPLSISPRFEFLDSQRAMCKAATLARRPSLASSPSGPRLPHFPRSHAGNSGALLPLSCSVGALLAATYIPPARPILVPNPLPLSALSIALPLPTHCVPGRWWALRLCRVISSDH